MNSYLQMLSHIS